MKPIKLAAVALNQTPLDWEGNASRIREALGKAREAGVSMVCLPELCVTGYGCEDAFFMPETCERAWEVLEGLLLETRGMVVALGLPVFHQRALWNVSAVAVDGELVGLVAKRNLAGDGVHYEPRWFKPWPAGVVDGYGTIPIGDLVIDVGGVKLGFEICEDAWVADRPGADLAARGLDVIFNPSASHFAFGKARLRRRFVAEGSRAFGAVYVYSNLLGNEAGRVIYDGQLMVAQEGSIIAESRRFGFVDVEILEATVDVQAGRLAIARSASYRPELPVAGDVGSVAVGFDWPDCKAVIHAEVVHDAEADGKLDEFTRAVGLGLFDYLRKAGARGYVVSMSGGADSAAAACLVRLMWEMARADLGADFAGKLAPDDFKELLLTAYQATRNSGEVTRDAAARVAGALGATHRVLDVSAIHEAYVRMVGEAFGEKLDWERHDIPLQNIQARVRSPGIWMLANLRGAILLTTSNRSEAAVGYATMDGDTSGGLAPISGIDKAFLREWLRWLETDGPVIAGARRCFPELAAVNVQQPTAELRPQGEGQTDEGDLMPYPVLDFIERAFIRDRKSADEIMELLGVAFPEIGEETAAGWVVKFFRLWRQNQWKRERYAPCFHLDDENLDPKTFCRWPILSGKIL
jgi:NAD+ synthase (glutamine-hydrolysing)